MKLQDIDPKTLADDVHNMIVDRASRLAFEVGYELREAIGVSNARLTVHQLAHYARTGEPPEYRRELVHEYLVSLVGVDLIPDLDPDDEPEASNEVEQAVHLVVLAVLARERLADEEPVPSAWLAALGGVTPSNIRYLLGRGELRRWRRGVEDDRRAYVHPDDAKRWIEGRRTS